MSVHEIDGNRPLDELGHVLRRELDASRARLEQIRARRIALQSDLNATAAAEDEAQQAFNALQAVAAQAIDLVPSLNGRLEGMAGGDFSMDGSHGHVRLAGAELREMAAIAALRRAAHGTPMHWRTWLEWLRQDGFEAAGKKAEATFLTQLARSPLVRRTPQDGVYLLDVSLFESQRHALRGLHEQLSCMPPPDQLTMLGDTRERRRALQGEIARVERSIEEMWRVLQQVPPPDWPKGIDPAPERIVNAWLALATPDAVASGVMPVATTASSELM